MDEVARQSQASLDQGSKSFAAAARLFDRETRDSVRLLYAWCRHCDDVVDGQQLGFNRAAADVAAEGDPETRLARLYEQTAAVYRGEAVADPVFEAFRRVVERHAIPRALAEDLLAGLRMDVAEHHYATLDDTLRYSYHVAGVVGVMMARIMGVDDDDTLDRACDLGLGFQLTNIARDIAEDARMGRCYLPADWLDEAGLTAADLGDPDRAEQVAPLARRLVATAEPYYSSALDGIARLPWRSAWAIAAARLVYRDIGQRIRRRGADAIRQRTSTSTARKLALLTAATAQATLRQRRTPSPRTDLWTRPR